MLLHTGRPRSVLRANVVEMLNSEELGLHQVWIKPAGEMPFLYGNHVVKAHLGRITEDTPEHQGVVVYNMSDVPLVRLPLPS